MVDTFGRIRPGDPLDEALSDFFPGLPTHIPTETELAEFFATLSCRLCKQKPVVGIVSSFVPWINPITFEPDPIQGTLKSAWLCAQCLPAERK